MWNSDVGKFYNREDGTEINWLKDYTVKGREANFVEEYAFEFTNILSLLIYSSHVLGKWAREAPKTYLVWCQPELTNGP